MNSRLKVFLSISIVLNLLLAGMLLGDMSRRLISPDGYDSAAALAKLPPEKRELLSSILAPAQKKMEAERAQIDAAKKDGMRIFTSEPFNEQEYVAHVQKISGMYAQMKRDLAESVGKLAVQFTASERAVLADIVSHPPYSLAPHTARQAGAP